MSTPSASATIATTSRSPSTTEPIRLSQAQAAGITSPASTRSPTTSTRRSLGPSGSGTPERRWRWSWRLAGIGRYAIATQTWSTGATKRWTCPALTTIPRCVPRRSGRRASGCSGSGAPPSNRRCSPTLSPSPVPSAIPTSSPRRSSGAPTQRQMRAGSMPQPRSPTRHCSGRPLRRTTGSARWQPVRRR